jgi:hypothetical protein
MDPSACSSRRMDDPCRAYCSRKSSHRRYSRCDPEHLLDNRQLVLSRRAFPSLLSKDTPTSPTARSYSHDCPSVLLPYVSLGNGHPLRERTTRWSLRRPHSMGADRWRCTKHTLKKMAFLRSRRPVRFPPLFLPTGAHKTTNPKQFFAFDALHELQPMAFCDQSVSLNICTCSQAAYGTSHVIGCWLNPSCQWQLTLWILKGSSPAPTYPPP